MEHTTRRFCLLCLAKASLDLELELISKPKKYTRGWYICILSGITVSGQFSSGLLLTNDASWFPANNININDITLTNCISLMRGVRGYLFFYFYSIFVGVFAIKYMLKKCLSLNILSLNFLYTTYLWIKRYP